MFIIYIYIYTYLSVCNSHICIIYLYMYVYDCIYHMSLLSEMTLLNIYIYILLIYII